jgi:hypothetical protein
MAGCPQRRPVEFDTALHRFASATPMAFLLGFERTHESSMPEAARM